MIQNHPREDLNEILHQFQQHAINHEILPNFKLYNHVIEYSIEFHELSQTGMICILHNNLLTHLRTLTPLPKDYICLECTNKKAYIHFSDGRYETFCKHSDYIKDEINVFLDEYF